MQRIMLILAIIVIPLVYMKYSDEEQILIPNDAVRIRVIANSNTIEDQNEKLEVRRDIQSYLKKILKDANSKEQTATLLNDNLLGIDHEVKSTLRKLHSDTTYRINYGSNFFPEKEFKGVKYDPGYYDSLVITLGKGQGNNWWCVLFPPLCLTEVEEENMNDVSYQLFVNEVISNYK